MPLHRLSLALLLAAAAPAPAAAQRISYDSTAASWTLISGPVCYRLVRRGQYLGFDHFGPASAMPAAPDTAALPRYDLTGLAEDQSLAPTSLRLRSDSVVQLAPDVEELRLRFVHATLPLELEVRYTAWGGDRSLLPRGPPHESGPASGARGFAAQHHVGASRRRLHAAVSLGRLGTRAAVGYGNAGRGRPAIRATRGRSTNGYVPWLSLRNRTLGIEYIAELAWSGNWWMQVERQPGTGAAPLRDQPVEVGLGMRNDFGAPLTLAPGDTITLPRAVFTAARGDLDDAANQMHRYQRMYLIPQVATNQPPLVQFNTWFPLGPAVDIVNTKRAAAAAACPRCPRPYSPKNARAA